MGFPDRTAPRCAAADGGNEFRYRIRSGNPRTGLVLRRCGDGARAALRTSRPVMDSGVAPHAVPVRQRNTSHEENENAAHQDREP